jgi:hypothetical protein
MGASYLVLRSLLDLSLPLLWKAVEALNMHEDVMSDIEWAI